MLQVRQGDVLIIKTKIPKSAEKIENKKRIILAEGEATGHAHAINDVVNAAMFFDKENNKIYIMITKPVKIEHEEHGIIDLPIGDYQVIRQRQYTPERIINVAD